jgi:hypothetical protein
MIISGKNRFLTAQCLAVGVALVGFALYALGCWRKLWLKPRRRPPRPPAWPPTRNPRSHLSQFLQQRHKALSLRLRFLYTS